ncbi:TPA: AAA family ATPase, partial [Acinetobacter baumannii]|nr:AAA family ATPase [Acinetobacter baumannii]
MLLKNLKIFSNGIEIRNIPFKTGLNLILDNETILGTESGNSIGKTTLLRIVDYCLGSDGKDIYTDPEFKTEYNTEVYNFVQNNQVSAQLELTLRNNTNIILERNLIIEGEKYYKINDEEISSITKYREKLSELIFKNKASKPSLRQLVPKFIRSDASKMSNTIMYLHKSTSPREYEPIFLFLFGFPEPTLFSNKSSLSREQKDYEKRLSVYEKPHSKNVIEQMLNVVNGNIVSEEIKINEFRLSDAYHHELE